MFVSIYVWWKFTPAKLRFAMQEPKQENLKKYRALIDFISSIVAHTGLDGLRDVYPLKQKVIFGWSISCKQRNYVIHSWLS